MKVIESFLSIQGEGAFAGRLAIFIRLAGCNFTCAGFGCEMISAKTGELLRGCDTIKAAQSSHFTHLIKELDFSSLCALVEGYAAPNAMVVITGGEPFIQQKSEDFKRFISWLILQKRLVQFESNGSIEPDFSACKALSSCHFALSIKLSNSGESEQKRINAKAIKSIFANARAFYKFVLSDEKQLDEIEKILQIQKGEVYLMPLGKSQKELSQNAPKIAQIAIAKGYNYSDRIHIRLWDDKEGV